MHGNIPNMFDYCPAPVVHLILQLSSIVRTLPEKSEADVAALGFLFKYSHKLCSKIFCSIGSKKFRH